MNRLVIIGNGFDLAHGLKTRYEDFLLWMIKKNIIELINNSKNNSQNEFFEIRLVNYFSEYKQNLFMRIDEISDLNSFLNSKFIIKKDINELNSPLNKTKLLNFENNITEIHYSIKSSLLNSIFQNKNWTDIEKYYFDLLLEIYNRYKKLTTFSKNDFEKMILELNINFKMIKNELLEYIGSINDYIKKNQLPKFWDLFQQINNNMIDEKYFEDYFTNYSGVNKSLNKVVFLNFNYTDLLKDKYKDLIKGIIYDIHGSASNNDIIFGYGDLSHNKYSELENEDNFELLKNMKSFYYPKDQNYIDIMNFLAFEQFDVFVIGHSLGLSDRVMLKSIFEHQNCKAIRLFHKGGNSDESHFKKRIALSRHFSSENKGRMNQMIIPYDKNDIID